MPVSVPMSAAPIYSPRISGDWSSAPIALMIPSTAAQMPSAGSASEIVVIDEHGLVFCFFSVLISCSISPSISCERALPMMIRRT